MTVPSTALCVVLHYSYDSADLLPVAIVHLKYQRTETAGSFNTVTLMMAGPHISNMSHSVRVLARLSMCNTNSPVADAQGVVVGVV